MDTTERLVEAYIRYIKGWATIPNIKCNGQYEIDLLAVDPLTQKHYHIETSVSVSSGFSKLTNKSFSVEKLKQRVDAPSQRRTIGYFVERKFTSEKVIDKLKEYGFQEGNYGRIIVSLGWTNDVPPVASTNGIELWDIRDMLNEIADYCRSESSHFADDTLRTLQLFCIATKANERKIQ